MGADLVVDLNPPDLVVEEIDSIERGRTVVLGDNGARLAVSSVRGVGGYGGDGFVHTRVFEWGGSCGSGSLGSWEQKG